MKMKNKNTDLTVLPIIEYEYTEETAKALVAGFPTLPEFEPSLGKKIQSTQRLFQTANSGTKWRVRERR